MNIKALLYDVISMFFRVLQMAIFIRVIFSWLPINMPNILYQITEPILGPIRRMIDRSPLGGMMLDFSPVIAMLLMEFVAAILLNILAAF